MRVRRMLTATLVALGLVLGGLAAATPAQATSGYKNHKGQYEIRYSAVAVGTSLYPAAYVHYSWSYMWKMKEYAEGWGNIPVGAVNVMCGRLPDIKTKLACTVAIQAYYSLLKRRINTAIREKRCLALRFSMDPVRHYSHLMLDKVYSTKCYR